MPSKVPNLPDGVQVINVGQSSFEMTETIVEVKVTLQDTLNSGLTYIGLAAGPAISYGSSNMDALVAEATEMALKMREREGPEEG